MNKNSFVLRQKVKNTKLIFIISFLKLFAKVVKRPREEALIVQTERLIKRGVRALLFTELVEIVCLKVNIKNQS
jgi:hypothetical protein